MTSLKRNHTKKIYYFDRDSHDNKNQNGLKEFIYFLKSKGIYHNIDFSYANAEDSLHGHLSIKDNFILDSVPTSLIKDSELNLADFMASVQNIHLKKILSQLGDLNRPVKELSKKQIKLTSIIKVILSQSKYIFLVNPDEDLDHNDLEQIKQCLEYEVNHNSRIIMFQSKSKMLWPDIVTNIISKDDKQDFIDTPNPLFENPKTEKAPFTYNFSLNKKVS